MEAGKVLMMIVRAVTEKLTGQAVAEELTGQAVTEELTGQAVKRIMIATSEIIAIMTVIAGIVTITGPGIQKKEEITEGNMTIADTDATAIGAEAVVAAGAGAGMSMGQACLGIRTKRKLGLPRAI